MMPVVRTCTLAVDTICCMVSAILKARVTKELRVRPGIVGTEHLSSALLFMLHLADFQLQILNEVHPCS